MFNFFKKKAKVEFSRENIDSPCIPYACHYDKDTLLTKNGELMQLIKVEGYSKELTQYYNSDLRAIIRKAIMDNITDHKFAVYFHTIRSKHNLDSVNYYSWTFAKDTHDGWAKKNHWKDKYVNELYITIIHEGEATNTKKQAILSTIPKLLKKNHMDALEVNAASLTNIVDNMLEVLKTFGAKKLGIKNDHLGAHSESLEFLSKIVCLHKKRIAVPICDLSTIFCQTKVAFGGNTLEIVDDEERHFAAMFTIKEYHEFSAKALDKFLRISSEFVITQTLNFVNSKEAKDSFKHLDYILRVSKDETLRKYSGLSATMSSDTGKDTDYASQQMSVMIVGDSIENLNSAVSSVMKEIRKLGIVMIREDLNIELSFWSQLPGNFYFFRRPSYINTARSASFASLHNTPSGNTENVWGDSLTLFRKENGAPHFFNLHVDNVGHTLIAGTTNSAKETLTNFLLSESTKYNPNIFYIDQHETSQVTIKALGGKYYKISLEDEKSSLKLNPFISEVTENKKNFIKNWLLLLIPSGTNLTAEQKKDLDDAVDNLYKQPERQLSILVKYLKDEELIKQLSIWCRPNKLGLLFDNSLDEIEDGVKNIGINIGILMESDNKIAVAPFMEYCLYEYEKTLNKTPSIIIINDANNLLQHKIFASRLAILLDNMTKKNALAIFVCNIENEINANISSINNKFATSLFLPDKEPRKYQETLNLNQETISAIYNLKLIYRHFLIKQNNQLIVVELNLDGMDYAIKALSGKDDAINAMNNAIEKFGDNPNRWIIPFYKNLFPEHNNKL